MDDYCQVCGVELQAFVRCFEASPFIDGRNYDLICWTCACVPKYWYIDDEGNTITFDNPDPAHMRNISEMVEEGWNKAKAEYSIKAIMKKLKSPKINIMSDQQHIFAQLFLSDTIDMIINV